MDIKLDIKMEQVARAIKSDMEPLGLGQLVFAWDNDKQYVVYGAHCGYDKHYDSETGALLSKRHKIEVYSWDYDGHVYSFDNAVCVEDADLPIVITKNGTGRLCGIIGNDCKVFDFKDHTIVTVPKDSIVMFDWQKLNGDKQ